MDQDPMLREETTQLCEGLETDFGRAGVPIVEDIRDQLKSIEEGLAKFNERLERHSKEVSQRFDNLESFLRGKLTH
jgi:predicted nuclease with TOPRIM domain